MPMRAVSDGDFARSKSFFRRLVARLKKSAHHFFDSSPSSAFEV